MWQCGSASAPNCQKLDLGSKCHPCFEVEVHLYTLAARVVERMPSRPILLAFLKATGEAITIRTERSRVTSKPPKKKGKHWFSPGEGWSSR